MNPDFADENILFTDISIASVKAMSVRESPGVVTLVTRQEIERSGARDLVDVLRLVPGFEFGTDVWGAVGIGFRGNWANEGKVSLRLDGQEMNELFYTNTAFGNHFPVEQIERVEIIRGPGSAIYGGCAELAVINIITKGPDQNGAEATVTYGRMETTDARRNGSISYGKNTGDLSFSGSVFAGQGTRSDKLFTDINGSSYDMDKNSRLDPFNANGFVSYRGLSVRTIIDHYHMTQRDAYGSDNATATENDWDTAIVSAEYDYNLCQSLMLTPGFQYKRQTPWKTTGGGLFVAPFNQEVERITGSLSFSYDANESLNLIGGVESYIDRAEDKTGGMIFDGRDKVDYSNVSGHIQGLLSNPIANVVAGARYEKHSAYGASFVPRVGVTKALDRAYCKVLGSQSFRAPSISNIQINKNIDPEKTTTWEFETGYDLTRHLTASANVFDTAIRGPIIYQVDPLTSVESYVNFDEIHTRGYELEVKSRGGWGYASVSYSFYDVLHSDALDYSVPGNDDVFLAFSPHKVAATASFNITNRLSLNPSVSYLGGRYGYSSKGDDGNPTIKNVAPACLLNIYLFYRNALMEDLDIGVGIYDVVNSGPDFIQPYNGGHPSIPGPSREILIRIRYKFL